MTARTDRKPDRELLLRVIDSLHVSKSNLRRDPCGDWNIVGRCGHISTDGSGNLHIYLLLETKRRWEITKRNLSFAAVAQDGDTEGVLKMRDLPTVGQAAALRKALGLRKVSPLTEGQRTALRRFSFARDKTALSGQIIAVTGKGGYPPSQQAVASTHHMGPSDPQKRSAAESGETGSATSLAEVLNSKTSTTSKSPGQLDLTWLVGVACPSRQPLEIGQRVICDFPSSVFLACGCGGTAFTVAKGFGPHFAQLVCDQCRRGGRWLDRQHL